MDIINKITIKSLRENKRRSIVTIMGTAISVALIFSMMITISSFMDMLKRDAIANRGAWTTQFSDVLGSEAKRLRTDENIESYLMFENIGTAKLEGSTNQSKPYVYIQACDMNDLKLISVKILEGRMPENENELIITPELLNSSGVTYAIGDHITYAIGNRYGLDSQGEKQILLDRNVGYDEGENFIPEYSKTYTIVGVVENMSKNYFSADYSVYTKMDQLKDDGVYQIYTSFTDISNSIYHKATTMQATYGTGRMDFNGTFLMAYGVSSNQTFLITMYSIVTFMAIIIMVGSISLIYNAFAISLAQRSRYLGMLSSIGATRRQKRNSVLFEAVLIGVIAIPLGMLIAYVGMAVTFYLLSDTFKMLVNSSTDMHLIVNLPSIIIAILFSMLVLLLSAWMPAKRASKITPIAAIRQNEDINIRAKNVRTLKLTRKLLGFEKELALKNIKRNRARYCATLISLIISFVLFVSAFSFVDFMQRSITMSTTEISFDVMVSAYNYNDENKEKRNLFFNEIQNVADYNSLDRVQTYANVMLDDSSHLSNRQIELMEKNYLKYFDDLSGFDNQVSVSIKGLDDKSLKEYTKKAGVKYNEEGKNAILINAYNLKHSLETKDTIYETVKATNYQIGDMLPLQINDKENSQKANIQLTGIASKFTDYQASFVEDPSQLTLVIDMQTYQQLIDGYEDSVEYFYTSEDASSLEANLFNVKNGFMDIETNIVNFEKGKAQSNQLILMVSVFLYGFVTLIMLICMANIFNTIATGVMLRRQEFAMLKSVGMNQKDFKKMIAYESLFYATKAIIYGIPLGLLCSYILYLAIGQSFEFAFPWPTMGILIISALVLLMMTLTTIYSLKKVKRDNIVETIKNENL